MKILNLISQRPEHTGSGVYLRALMHEAASAGHTGFLLAGVPADGYPVIDTIPGENCCFVEFEGRDLPYPVVGMSDIMPYRSRPFSSLTPVELDMYRTAFASKLEEAVSRFEPDIIHSHHLWILTALTRELFPDIPMVASCHGTGLRQAVTCPHLSESVKASCRTVNCITALGRMQAERITADYGIPVGQITVVGGGYNTDLFRSKPKKNENTVELLYAGKLSAAKGVPWLLKAMKRIGNLPWRLHLAGSSSGREYDECVVLAKDLGKRVIFHGLVSQPELAELMQMSHIFVLPSFYEGLPLVLLEALACGCRIVSTRLPGTREIFQAVDSDDVKLLELPELESVDKPYQEDEPLLETKLAEALAGLIETARNAPDIDLSRYSNILEHYTWQRVFGRVGEIYKSYNISTK